MFNFTTERQLFRTASANGTTRGPRTAFPMKLDGKSANGFRMAILSINNVYRTGGGLVNCEVDGNRIRWINAIDLAHASQMRGNGQRVDLVKMGELFRELAIELQRISKQNYLLQCRSFTFVDMFTFWNKSGGWLVSCLFYSSFLAILLNIRRAFSNFCSIFQAFIYRCNSFI